MGKSGSIWLAFWVVGGVAFSAGGSPPSTNLTPTELQEVTRRIERFYKDASDASAMQVPIPKHSAVSGEPVSLNPQLRLKNPNVSDPLLRLAQAKATPQYEKAFCDKVARQYFPGLVCETGRDTWATIESNDKVESLMNTWGAPPSHDLDAVATSGQTAMPIWSDDYWRTKWGQTSYRYAYRTQHYTYQEAIRSYSQPSEWEGLLAWLDPSALAGRIVYWSPAEKYDLSVGDERFSLTNQQKRTGMQYGGEPENWMGLCHGWAAASVMVPRPSGTAQLVGPRGLGVSWYPADVRALLTLAWANGTALSNFVGGRCRTKGPATFGNGRLQQQECFDNNPATLHLALGNMIGRDRLSFIMDATFDYEVWNQPIYSYDFTYFNPLNSRQVSKQWRDVAVDYDANFKAYDRFQRPMTRGVRVQGGWNDSQVRKIVGVRATVVYLVEQQPPPHTATAGNDEFARATYTYDLELAEENGRYVATGGEWHENAHPDFLWMPRRDTSVRTSYDYLNIGFTGSAVPSSEVTDTARQASSQGYPLCQVLKQLVRQSAGVDGYRCPEPLR